MIFKKKQFWGTIIAIGLLAFCLKDIRYEDVRELSRRLDLIYLIPSVVCSFMFAICKALRWRLMIGQQKKTKAFRIISLYSAGQILNIVMPALTGQVGRMFLFSKNEGLRKTFVFSTIVLEVLFDAIALIIFLMVTSLAFVFPEEYRTIGFIIAAVTGIVLVILYVLLHFQASMEGLSRRLLRNRWPNLYIGIKKFMRSFMQGINLLRSSQHFIGSLLYSLALWFFHTFAVYYLMKSFGFHSLPFAAAASVMLVNTLALMVPITPVNAGTFEAAVSYSLALFRVGRSDAVLYAIALHLLDLLPITILGLTYLKQEKISIRDIQEKHGEDDIFDEISEDGTYLEREEQV